MKDRIVLEVLPGKNFSYNKHNSLCKTVYR